MENPKTLQRQYAAQKSLCHSSSSFSRLASSREERGASATTFGIRASLVHVGHERIPTGEVQNSIGIGIGEER